MKIGIFDSGLGGLSVLHCAQVMRPDYEYVFYADEKNVPYGEKTVLKVREYTKRALDFLVRKKVDVIIIACNTATSSFPMAIRGKYSIPIIGMEPAVKRAVDLYGNENKRILTITTEITVHEEKTEQLMEKVDINNQIDLLALPGLVRFAEKGIFSGPVVNTYLRMALKNFDKDRYGTIVLGCTHFNYFKEALMEVFSGNLHFVDGNEGTVRQAFQSITNQKIDTVVTTENNEPKVTYYISEMQPNGEQESLIAACFKQLNRVYSL